MSAPGQIVLMGSGELTPTMVPVHRELLRQFDGPRATRHAWIPLDAISSCSVGWPARNV